MKLTIKNGLGLNKVVDLNKNLEFNVSKGEQYIFSSGFSNYILNFEDNQESILLVFNVDGKSIQVQLKGIVPLLQENTPNMENPTAVIINKNVNDKDLDELIENSQFSGSEIIDRLEIIASRPVETGTDDNLALITNFQTLLDSLGAAAAGPAGGDAAGNGSTFNSIFGPISDQLNGIAPSDVWENLSESITSLPVDPGDETGANTVTIPGIYVTGQTVNEADGTITFTISLTEATTQTVTVDFTTIDGTAIAGSDYTTTSGTVTFAPNTTVQYITVPVIDDNVYENDESFNVVLSGAVNAEIADELGVGTITDESVPTNPDDQTALVSIEGPSNVTEGDVTTPYTVSITQAPETDLEVFFTYTGVAKDGTDFTGVSSVIIKAGETSATFTIATLDDNLAEGSENFTVSIDSTKLGAVGGLEDVRVDTTKDAVETTITDESVPTNPDDQTALVSIEGPSNVTEGDVTTPYTVSITQAPETDLEVFFTYTGVAKDGTDFTGVSSVIIKAGETSATFTIATLDDNLAEGSENFTVSIDSTKLGAVGGLEDVRVDTTKDAVETTITDESVPTNPDDQTALVSIEGPSNVTEGDVTTPYTVSITQAPETDLEVFFTYTGVAKDGTDFTGVSSVIIKAGETSATFTIATLDDNLAEGSENFTVSIDSTKLGAVGGLEDVRVDTTKDAVETTITDESVPTNPDDQTALVSIEGPSNVTEGDVTTPYTVSITQAPETDLEVFFTYTGVAKDGTDFTGVSSVIIKAGETSATFTIATLDDNLAEGSENFTVSIDSTKLGAVGGLEDVRVDTTKDAVETTITDESDPSNPTDPETPGAKDNVNVKLVGVNTDVVEGESATYKVTLTDDKGNPVVAKEDMEVTFTYTYTTASGDDITETVSVIIPKGSSEVPVEVATIDDVYAEGTEEFTIEINTVSNQDQFEQVTVDKTPVVTTITDESDPSNPTDPETPGAKDNVNVKLVGVNTDVVEGESATYKVTLTDDKGNPVVAKEDMEVTFTYTYTTASGDDITETVSVIIPKGSSEVPVEVATIDDVYAEGTEEFTIEINTVSNQDQFEQVTVDKTPVVTTITDESDPSNPTDPETPGAKDNVNVKLVGVNTDVVEGESATYKVTLTDDKGNPVVAKEDMEVTFTYTYTTASGDDITETVSVIIPKGSSEVPVEVATIDDVYAEGTEEFTIEINTVSNQDQFEQVTVDKTPVVTTITDESDPSNPTDPETPGAKDNVNVKLVGVNTDVVEGESATYKVTLTDDKGNPVVAKEDMEVTFTYTYTTASGDDITETVSVIIPKGSSEVPVEVATIDDVYAEGTEEFTIEINTVSNQDQFEQVTVDKTPVVTTITDESDPSNPTDPETPGAKDNVNVKLVGVNTDVVEGESATYKVTLTDDKGNPVVAKEDMEVTFTYTYTTASGDDITETVSVIIPKGSSEVPVEVATIDDVYAEGTEEFTIEINTVSNQDQFEQVTVDKTPVVTTITDESDPSNPTDPETPGAKDNVNVKLVGVNTDVVEGESATYKVTLTDDKGNPVVAKEDMEVTFTYTYTTASGDDITETVSVIIPKGSSEVPVEVATIDDVYAEGTEEFTIEINTVSNQDQFEQVTVDKTPVVTTITDESDPSNPTDPETPGAKDNVNVKLVGVNTDVVEGESATYKVTLTDDKGNPVVAKEDMEVTFTYTYTTASGDDITETVSVIIPKGSSEVPVEVATIDDVYAEGTEEFTIEINTVSNQDQFEQVTVDKTPVVTTITDESDPSNPTDPETPGAKDNVNVKLVGVNTDVVEGESATYKVTLTDDKGNPVVAKEDMEVTFTYTYTTASGDDITETVSVIIPKGSSEVPVEVATIDDVYAEGTEEFTIEINTVSNQDQFEQVTVDKTPVVTTITDESDPSNPTDPETPGAKDNVNVKLVGVNTDVVEGESATYKVTLTDDKGNPVVAKEDMEVTFTYTYTTASGDDITETVSVIIPKGSSEVPVEVATIDDVYAEGTEEFTIEINTVSNQDQFEQVTVDKTPVVTTITDESDPSNPTDPETPGAKDNVNVKLVGVNTDVVEGESATYKVTLTDDKGNPVVAKEDMEVTFTYTYTTASGDDITETVSVIIPKGSSEVPVEVATIDDVYAEGTEEFTIEINTVSNQDQFEQVTVDKTPVVTTITDESDPSNPTDPETPGAKDNVNVKLVGVNTDVVEGESATYKVTLTDDKGNPVVAKEDMEVTFTYTYTTASGDDITETVSVIIPKGSSEVPVEVATIDDVYAEGTEEFTIEINTVSNQDQFEQVTVDKTPVVTTITDESDPSNPTDPETPGAKDNVNVKLVGVNTDVVEGESATYKVTLTDDKGNPVVAKEDMEVTFTYTYTTASGDDITETVSVIIPKGSSEVPVEVATIDDVYAEGTEEFTIEINTVSNQDQFEQVTVDKTPVVTTITDNDYKLTTDDSFSTKEDTPYTLNINDFGTPLTTITKVKIVEVPTNGQLLLNGTIVNAGQEINRIDIDSGKLVFKPNSNTDENGNFEFLVNDGTKWANVETTTEIIVTAVADTPITSIDAVKLSSGEYTVKIDAALTDTDGSETLTVKISNVPNGAELSSTKYEVTKNADGSWNVKVPAGSTSISDTLVMNNVPQGTDWVNLKITATATEKNDNNDGKNFAIAEANDSTVHSVGESDQVCMESFKYNIMITLDNSWSMRDDKITLAKAAMVNLVNKYTDLGEVRVTLNVFNQYGEIKALWVTPAEAISLIDQITAAMGGTNYDDALLKNIDTLSKNPAPLDGKTISYFVSDGQPSYGMKQDSNGEWVLNTSANGVNAELSSQYKNLNFDKSYAIGIGTSELNTHLNAVSNDVIIISNATQLSQTLEDTVQELLVEGNFLDNVIGGDGKITADTITFEGTVYTKDTFPINGIVSGDNHIKLTVDFETGEYKYYAKSSKFTEEIKVFTVEASDNNGDKVKYDVEAEVKVVTGKAENVQQLTGEDIDLSKVITKTTDAIDMENNSTTDKLKVELQDILDLNNKELIIKGDLGDIVELDKPATDWVKGQTQQIDGKNYNVYTNATVKLLIEDDIDVIPDI